MAPTIKVGDTIPEATFTYIAYTPELEAKVCRVDPYCELKITPLIKMSACLWYS